MDAVTFLINLLQAIDLAVPDADQAATLLRLFALPDDLRRKLGWTAGYANFWCRDRERGLIGASSEASMLPLYLVARTD